MADERWLITGLGNPGPEYAGHRHNAGFMVADLLAARAGSRFRRDRARADVTVGRLTGLPVMPSVTTGWAELGVRLIVASVQGTRHLNERAVAAPHGAATAPLPR